MFRNLCEKLIRDQSSSWDVYLAYFQLSAMTADSYKKNTTELENGLGVSRLYVNMTQQHDSYDNYIWSKRHVCHHK